MSWQLVSQTPTWFAQLARQLPCRRLFDPLIALGLPTVQGAYRC